MLLKKYKMIKINTNEYIEYLLSIYVSEILSKKYYSIANDRIKDGYDVDGVVFFADTFDEMIKTEIERFDASENIEQFLKG